MAKPTAAQTDILSKLDGGAQLCRGKSSHKAWLRVDGSTMKVSGKTYRALRDHQWVQVEQETQHVIVYSISPAGKEARRLTDRGREAVEG